jgi:hypothetical protein
LLPDRGPNEAKLKKNTFLQRGLDKFGFIEAMGYSVQQLRGICRVAPSPIRRFASPRWSLLYRFSAIIIAAVVDDRWSRNRGVRGKSEHTKAACRAKARATDDESRG